MEVAEKFASAVDSFKTGIFPFFQALIDSQKALAVQLQKQSEVIQRLIQKPIAQAMTTKRGTPSISATGDWYGRKEFEEARNSTANVPTHNTTNRPIARDSNKSQQQKGHMICPYPAESLQPEQISFERNT